MSMSTHTLSIHQVAWEEMNKLGGLAPLKKIYQLVLNRFKDMDLPLPRLDSIRGALVDKTTSDPEGRTGRRAKGDFLFERIANGIYKIYDEEDTYCLLNESSRSLDVIEKESVSAVICDHPWKEGKNHKSGNQKNFAQDYEEHTFHYTLEDFKEKYRVLREGGYLVENVPTENAENTEYLMNIRQLAKEAGFQFYAIVPWIKHKTPSNTGRTQKDREYLIFWYKGKKPRRFAEEGKPYFTREMLPSEFDIPAPSKKSHQAEKPVKLYEKIIELITDPSDVVLDQFCGSGALIEAAINTKRFAIGYELMKDHALKIKERVKLSKLYKMSLTKTSGKKEVELAYDETGQAAFF